MLHTHVICLTVLDSQIHQNIDIFEEYEYIRNQNAKSVGSKYGSVESSIDSLYINSTVCLLSMVQVPSYKISINDTTILICF